MKNIFDSHAHYNDEQFDNDRNSLLASLPEAGIVGIINCGTDVNSSNKSIELAEKYPFVYAACGFHPEDADKADEEGFEKIKLMLSHKKCVAVGEIGLDYYWDNVPKEKQIEVFKKQLEMAKELDLPVIIHDREAHGDTMEIVKHYKPKGVMHCYSGSSEMAKEIIKLGMYIGFGGVLTFKNAVKSVDVLKEIPMERLLLETDCPYMAPVPMRGKRNQSDYIRYVAQKIAEIKASDPQSVLDITTENTMRLFKIK